jgi:putative membrane protein
LIRSRFLHYAVRSGLLFGFSFYILQLVRNDKILYYIAPRMVDYVKWSAIGLYAMAVYQAYLAVVTLWSRRQTECSCEVLPPFRIKAVLIYSVFAFPLILGYLMPDATMGSALAARKGVNLSSSETVKNGVPAGTGGSIDTNVKKGQPQGTAAASGDTVPRGNTGPSGSGAAAGSGEASPNPNELFPADRYMESYSRLAKDLYAKDKVEVKEELFIETISAVDLYLDRFVGKTIELSGFVFREEDMDKKAFIIARFALQCCSADAAPYGIMVEYDRASAFGDDSWVKVTGAIAKARYHDMDILTVKAMRIEKIPEPKTAYVYQNPDF